MRHPHALKENRADMSISENEVRYSIIVPVKNEEDNILPQIQEIVEAMEPLAEPYEIVYVDDGSTDNSWNLLLKARETFRQLHLVKLDRNHGQSAATDAGIRHALGEILITLDGDRQNVPADIPNLLKMLEDADMVCGYRAQRNDNSWRKIQSRIANGIRNSLTGDCIIDTGCSLKIFRKDCFEKVKFFNGMHRFMPTLARLEGWRIAQAPVSHRSRQCGVTKYSFRNRALRSFLDLLAVRWMIRRHLEHKVSQELLPAMVLDEKKALSK
jgi:dolichol-phosphate mannosyltransferase